MDTVALLGVCVLLFLKEAGIPVPVPADLIVLGSAIASSRGEPHPVLTLGAILVAGVLGGTVQFLLLAGPARPAVLRLLGRFGLTPERLDPHTDRLRRHGARGVAVARVTPGVRGLAVPASAIAAVPLPSFVIGLAAGNIVFVGAHFVAGYVLGEPALHLVSSLGTTLLAMAAFVAVVGLLGWFLVTRRRHVAGHGTGDDAEESVRSWSDAACPACLTVAAFRRVSGRSTVPDLGGPGASPRQR
jgi:membrane protein DedA with SNARE-associated domain